MLTPIQPFRLYQVETQFIKSQVFSNLFTDPDILQREEGEEEKEERLKKEEEERLKRKKKEKKKKKSIYDT